MLKLKMRGGEGGKSKERGRKEMRKQEIKIK